MPLLEVMDLTVMYGAQPAVDAVSLSVSDGEIVVVIGPNGAGKSTVIKAVGGIIPSVNGRIGKGTVTYRGKNIAGLRTDELVRLGISFVPDSHRVFPSMTVLENLEMGGYILDGKATLRRKIDEVIGLFPHLGERKKQAAGTMSLGERQMLAIGRALMLTPALLLVDEPSMGLSPNFVETIFARFAEINRTGTALLIVEQNARKALELCHRGYVFETGRIALEGSRGDLLGNPKIRYVYLGV
jgi:branched-chain amino acid transport system ATP-binding protein